MNRTTPYRNMNAKGGKTEAGAAERFSVSEREHREFRKAMLSVMEDLHETTEALTAATLELKKLSMAIEQSVGIVSIADRGGKIEYINPTFEAKTGYTKAEAAGRQTRELIFGEMDDERYEELQASVLSGNIWRGTVKNSRKTGGYYWCDTDVCPIKNESGEITHFLISQEDITERTRSDERLRHLAKYDALTGLLNRSRFMKLLSEWMDSSGTRGATGVLLLSDMDQFKLCNETYGHGTGDYILKTMANLINDVVERAYGEGIPKGADKPFIGRVGGDEFAVFLPSSDESQGMRTAELIRLAVGGFNFEEADISVTISIGAAGYPEHGAEIKELLTKADVARYRAKELGRNRCHLYRPEDQDLDKAHSKLQVKEKILKALKGNRFEPWFQPILDIKENCVSHYEVLARMIEEDGSVTLPGLFVDVAEWFGLITSIDRIIIEKAFGHQAQFGKNIKLSINLSGKELGDDELLAFLRSKISETGVDPRWIIFEITETAAISSIETAVKFVKALKSIGCKFALDDFGVGFTSFTYLKKLMVDYIKIDGAFIRRLHENADDQVFVKAIIDVARGLNIKSIAEFVEQEGALDFLKRHGADYAQGYFIGKPAPISATVKKAQ